MNEVSVRKMDETQHFSWTLAETILPSAGPAKHTNHGACQSEKSNTLSVPQPDGEWNQSPWLISWLLNSHKWERESECDVKEKEMEETNTIFHGKWQTLSADKEALTYKSKHFF